ncbi:MAG: hypothetical protein KMY55_10960 [Dethiosulfatibacter sp.]|nr:hypothetical protein [Dethiosulfatibacter sp.]
MGIRIDVNRLRDMSYHCYDNKDNSVWKLWTKSYNRGENLIAFKISDDGFIGSLENFMYFDLTYDYGIGAPYGYRNDLSLSKNMCTKIKNQFKSIEIDRLSENKEDMYRFFFHELLPENTLNDHSYTDDYKMDCLISDSLEAEKYDRCAFLFLNTFKHLDEITDYSVLGDMPFYAGKFSFIDEFACCIMRLTKTNFPLLDTQICNIGSVLCDSFEEYELALECFFEVLKMNPSLPQAKHNIFIAGKYCILKQAKYNSRVQDACELGEKIIEVGGESSTDYGFFSYLGLAYELNDNRGKALTFHKKALEIKPDCRVSKAALTRLSKEPYDKSRVKQEINFLNDPTTSPCLSSNRYLFDLMKRMRSE